MIGETLLGATPPALIIGFNRPDKLHECIKAALDAGVETIYISLDAPRSDYVTDIKKCDESYRIAHFFQSIVPGIAIRVNKSNLGCKFGPISAIDWFFEHEEFGMIIEDDIIISPDFVRFISENSFLVKQGFWHINGWSMYRSLDGIPNSYTTCFPMVWGWATWRTRWQALDLIIEDNFIENFDKSEVALSANLMYGFSDFWIEIFRSAEKRHAWDYFWVATIWKHGGLVAAPAHSLTKNIGFDKEATHTKFSNQLLRGDRQFRSTINVRWELLGPAPDLDLVTGKLIYGIDASEGNLFRAILKMPTRARYRVFLANFRRFSVNQIFKIKLRCKNSPLRLLRPRG
jgi:hypothetical protein